MQTVIYLYVASVAVQLLYWVLIFARLRGSSPPTHSAEAHSIVVCYKNETANLRRYLPALNRQRAAALILVDDYSTDGSQDIAISHSSVTTTTHLQSDTDRPGKKAALLKGVSSASTSAVVLTDSDTRPASDHWSEYMAAALADTSAVLGYAPMERRRGITATFARYETYLTGIQYLSYAQLGMPYMGVGRNMAIYRSAALPYLQDMVTSPLASGDDDMLIQALARDGSVGTCVAADAFVYSEPPVTWTAFLARKSRHITTSTSYTLVHQLMLGVFATSHMASYLLLVVSLLYFPSQWHFLVGILLLKWTVQLAVNRKLMRVLLEEDLWLKFPLLDIATFVYYLILTPYLFLKNKTTWSSY